ncbi:RNA-binding protein 20 isoform X2 [Stegostoma tigrinum]|uniref:RNA-binding protein 20 isoform X2 n=1 Tax=Stegostoma tigrinum TaxID=3053191 RepID=UPI0028703AF6|nr:RNA-binding protein 20 isoform X2 [Stegostoma tigrinum]
MKKQSRPFGTRTPAEKGAGDMSTHTSGAGPAGGEAQIGTSSVKSLDKNPFPINTHLSGGTPNPILPSAASVQLAQLQAQLTLQRLKFAQSAVNSNTTAATVLSQVLNKVAMSQPLFNTLRSPSLINATHGQAGAPQLGPGISGPTMPPHGLSYPSQTPGLPPLVAGSINQGGNLQPQSVGPIGLNPFAGIVSQPSAHPAAVINLNKTVSSHPPGGFSEYTGDFSNKTMHDEALCTQGFHQFGFTGDLANVLSANLASGNPVKGQHSVLNQPHSGFQQDFQASQGQPMCRMQAPSYSGEMNTCSYPQKPEGPHQINPTGNSQNLGTWVPDQWQTASQFLKPNRPEFTAQSPSLWSTKSQQLQMRNDLYNPEEPTSEGKINIGCPSPFDRFNQSNQNFAGAQFNQSDKQLHSTFHLQVPERHIQPYELNDFHGLVPTQLPHICSICDKKIFNLKDWEQHVNGKHHIQNCTLFSENSGIGSTNFTRPTNGGVNSCGSNMILNPSDLPPDNQSQLRTFSQQSRGFTSTSPGSKVFPQRNSGPSRVVHICNLPEGSCTENDVINLGLPFGKVTNYILMRATNQAFLEMAYHEAAQAMVQFYQQKPPAINEQQLLVRMSKQYKELKLKKPGKDVDSIINDINSQKEREIHKEWDRLERPRSRSPLTQPLSPRMESHSPSLASCPSSQRSSVSPRRNPLSPRGDRNNTTDRKGSQDYLSRKRREDEKAEPNAKIHCDLHRDGSDRWAYDRKQYLKSTGRSSPKSLEDREDGYQGHKDKYTKSSLQNLSASQSKYRVRNEEDFKKEQKLKSGRSLRPRGKDGELQQKPGLRENSGSHDQSNDKGEYDSPVSPAHTDTTQLALEEAERRQQKDGTSDSEVNEEDGQNSWKQSSSSHSTSRSPERELERNMKEQSESCESGSEAEGDAWYSGNMEEFVTVDEVGEEEDHVMELSETIENVCNQTEENGNMEKSNEDPIATKGIPDCEHHSDNHCRTSLEELCLMSPTLFPGNHQLKVESTSHPQITSSSMNETEQNLRSLVTEPESPVNCRNCDTDQGMSDDASRGYLDPESRSTADPSGETDGKFQEENFSEKLLETQGVDQSVPSFRSSSPETGELKKETLETFNKDSENSSQPLTESAGGHQHLTTRQRPQLPWEQANVFGNLSIPLGVEFVEARTGFYCKLCGLFYITEEAAKGSHCRSTVHYKNLQKYLSQLAEESLKEGEKASSSGTEEEVGIMPQFENKKSTPS